MIKWLFVPEESYFSNIIEEIKQQIATKIPYNDYITIFGEIENINAAGEISINLPEYKIADNLTIKQDNFIEFNKITRYKETWYKWVRAFTFIFMIIYNINQIMKFLRGFNIADYGTQLGMQQPNPWAISGQTSLFNKGGKK